MCLFILACVAPLRASELPKLEFSIKPRLCVLSGDEEACYDELEVRWSAEQTMNLCLYQSVDDEPLTCWQNTRSGVHHFVLTASQNITFYLREPGESWQVSEAFEVIHDHKKYRRQRRNPWSFF